MLISELLNEDFSFDKANYFGYWAPDEDSSTPRLGDLRRTRLTLKDIGRLRRMVDTRQAEQVKKSKFLRDIYKFVPKKPL